MKQSFETAVKTLLLAGISFYSIGISAQKRTVTGVVTDKNNEPLVG